MLSQIEREALDLLADRCGRLSADKGWHDPQERWGEDVKRDASPVERMMLIVSEASEMLEAFRDTHHPASSHTAENGKPEGVAAELADIMIRCFDYAFIYRVDLGYEIDRKLEYNKTRWYRHGGKVV